MSKFEESYYKTVNYSDYLQRGDRYYKLATELISLLKSLSLINGDSRILDYGAATGMLMAGFRDNRVHIYGYDISEWATRQARNKHLFMLDKPDGLYDVVFYLDVLEHICDEDITNIFNKCQSRVIIGRIPCADYGKDNFYLDVSKKDSTHINCKDKHQWTKLIKNAGYKNIFRLNLLTIFDSPGVFCFMATKDL